MISSGASSVGFSAFGSWLRSGDLIHVRPRKSAVEWLPFLFRPTLMAMSRKPVPIKIIDLEDGMPKVEEARLRMQRELQVARQQGYAAVKLIHGYGSSGVGGSLRIEL